MTSIIFPILIFFGVVYALTFVYMKHRKKQANTDLNIDYVAEEQNIPTYIEQMLQKELSFLRKETDLPKVDALTYARPVYTTEDALKDNAKNVLKGMATLGTVKFTTVITQKYLILSDYDLHLIDVDAEGDVSDHFVFDASRLKEASLSEYTGDREIEEIKKLSGNDIKSYLLSLPTDDKPIELIIFNTLIDMNSQAIFSTKSLIDKVKISRIIGKDFIQKLGERFDNLRV